MQSSDNLTRFAKVIRKYNGIADETDDNSDKIKNNTTVESTSENTTTTRSEDIVYEVNLWYDRNELVFFSGEKVNGIPGKSNNITNTDTSDTKATSVGSVGSITEPFALPMRCPTISSTNSSSTTADSCKLDQENVADGQKKVKQTITGTVELCKFMIEHFQAIGKSLSKDNTLSFDIAAARNHQLTPTGRRGKVVKELSTPSSTTSANKRKRSGIANLTEDEPKSAKKTKKETTSESRKSVDATATAAASPAYPEKAVLARWVDKKYYAGRVIEQKANHKYVVLFEDGAKKVLPEDNIVFGEESVLPLEKESVHALVKDDTYEPGIVQSVQVKDDAVYYTVACETITITVTASDIYLEEDQAKVILQKQDVTRSADNPEPGFSGAVSTRKDRRQKRYS